MKRTLKYFFLLMSILIAPVAYTQTIAFPEALGFGKNATGGRGGTVYHVTNLNDSGTGSFRDAVSASNRIIVFDVSGYITLKTAVSCKSNLTIAGQTAPGEGIGFMGGEISFAKSSNIICRYIRIRPGSQTASDEDDALSIYRAHNVILDHCSFEYAPWNNIDGVSDDYQNYPVTDITFQSCLIANPTGQQFGAHCESVNSNWSWYYNIFANSHNRNPLSKINNVFVNNVLYNCSAGYTTHTSTNFKHDIVNNYFIFGPASTGTDNTWYQVDKNQSIYYSGNIKDNNLDGTLNGSATTPYWYQGAGTILSSPWSTATTSVTAYSTATAYRYNTSLSGTFPYDESDRLILSQVQTLGKGTTGTTAGTRGPSGGLYTSQAQTGLSNNGYGTIATGTKPTDTDKDGMPDFWEKTNSSDPAKDDAMKVGTDGYTLIEKYINWLGVIHAQTTTNTYVDIDLRTYTEGFKNVSPVYSVSNKLNGTVALLSDGHTARFTPTTNYFGMASYAFTVKGSDNTTVTLAIAVAVVPTGTNCAGVVTPTITSPSTSFCTGGSVVLTSSTGTSYKWFNGTIQVGTATTYTATAAGSYTVEVTNAAGCKATSAAKVITVNALPTATITSPSTSFCTGGSVVLTSSTGASYKWFNGTTQVGTAATYTATAAGSYTVEVTNAAGCKATSAAKVITVNALPTATITSPSTSFCTGGSVVLTSSTGASYKWFNGTTQVGVAATYTATADGSYTVEVTNTAGCKATSAAKVITVNALPTATITSPSTSFCTGGSVVLTSSTGASYKWFNGTTQVGTAATYTATTAGSYTVEVTNTAGCKATSAAKVITVNELPTATISSPSTSFCTGGSVVLTSSTGASYKWFNGTTQVGAAATYTATAAGSYTVEVTNTAGCKAASAATVITVSTPTTATISSPSTSFCTGGSVVLTSSTGASYKWFNGATQIGTAATYTVTAAGSYTVEVTNTAGCKATSAATVMTVSAAPTATITSPSTSFCTGGSVVLTSSTGASYKWFNGTTQVGTAAMYTAITAGSYTVEVTNTSGCKATSAATVITVSVLPTATVTSPSTSFCTGGSVVLTSSIGSSYKWFNGTSQVGTAATYTATANGSYTVEVTNTAGCKATSAATQIMSTTAIVWYADADDDGKGDPAITQTSCAQPAGYVSVAGDACPFDANKIAAGACGCGKTETDTDGDNIPDCIDSDDDNDGVPDTDDCAPLDASVGVIAVWYQDADGDGKGDASSTLNACAKPDGYVSSAGDTCPADADKTAPGNCGCGKTENSCLDCAGVANGLAVLDNCGICTGGTTGKSACVATATINGTSTNIKVIPQPFDNSTTITLENMGVMQAVTIISASGAIVDYRQELNTTVITLGEQLSAGLYSVIIQSNQGTYVTKIVKK